MKAVAALRAWLDRKRARRDVLELLDSIHHAVDQMAQGYVILESRVSALEERVEEMPDVADELHRIDSRVYLHHQTLTSLHATLAHFVAGRKE